MVSIHDTQMNKGKEKKIHNLRTSFGFNLKEP